MGNTKISSENQSGGITAQNVNLGNQIAPKPERPKQSRSAKIWAAIIGIATIIGTVVAVLAYFASTHK